MLNVGGKMLDKLFGFLSSEDVVNHAFSYEHLILVIVCAAVLVFLLVLLRKASPRLKKLATLCVCMAFVLLEILRLVWRYLKLKNLAQSQTVWEFLDLNFTTLVVWLSIIFLIISLFTNRYSKYNRFVYTFVFSLGILAAGYFFIYPVSLDGGYSMLHLINLVDILTNLLLLFIATFIAFSDLIDVAINDNWVSWLILFSMIGIAFGIYYWSEKTVNILFVKNCPPLEALGMQISYPYHIIIVTILLFILNIAIYLPFEIIAKKRMKKIGKPK